MRVETIGPATLYLADCREVLPTLEGIHALITDPPYGVDFKGKATKHTINRPELVYEDGETEFRSGVLPAFKMALERVERCLVFTGTRRLHEYPQPDDIGGIVCPNGGGRSAWGFGCYHPALYYGRSPHIAKGMGARPTAKVIYHPGMHVTGEAVGNDHPCPKPIAFMNWAVDLASFPGETVLDPFMGSGTTGVSAVQLGRNFVGIEREPRFFDIACQRIEDAQRQGDMFREVAA